MNAMEVARVLTAFGLICLAAIACVCGSAETAIAASATAGMLLTCSAFTDWEGGK